MPVRPAWVIVKDLLTNSFYDRNYHLCKLLLVILEVGVLNLAPSANNFTMCMAATIEHIAPQTPRYTPFWLPFMHPAYENVHKLRNLVLLEPYLQSRAGNLILMSKITRAYSHSVFQGPKVFCLAPYSSLQEDTLAPGVQGFACHPLTPAILEDRGEGRIQSIWQWLFY